MSDFGYKGSITALESGINRIANDLRLEGYKVLVDVFKGQSNCPITGYQSNVDIEVMDSEGDELACFNIECNGYGDEIKTMKGIRAAVRDAVRESSSDDVVEVCSVGLTVHDWKDCNCSNCQ